MSTQTVYFNNPATITSIQSQIGTVPNQVNTDSVFANRVITCYNNIYTGAATSFTTYMSSLLSCSSGPTGSDSNGVAHNGMFCIGGNAFTNSEVFASVGVANSTGASWTSDKYVRLASQSKIIGGLSIAKIMEEGYMKPDDLVFKYIPSFTGPCYYISSATGTLGSYLSGPGSYTGTLLPYNLQNLTIAHLLGFQFAVPSTEFFFGTSRLSWETTSPPDFSLNYAYSKMLNGGALQLGASLGSSGSLSTQTGLIAPGYLNFNKIGNNYVYGSETDFVLTLANCLKNGSVVLTFRPGQTATGFNGLLVPRAQYGITFSILSYCCQQALIQGGYTSPLYTYIRDKLFTPIGITNELWRSNCETGPSDQPGRLVEVSFRHSYTLTTGPWATGTLTAPNNTLVWSSQYQGDSYSSYTSSFFYKNTDFPSFNGGLVGTPSMYCKLLKLIINNGVYGGKQIVAKHSIKWMFNSFGAAGQLFEARSLYAGGGPSANQKWCLGFVKTDDSVASAYNEENSGNIGILTFPMTSNVCGWGGFYGTQFLFDIETGYYICMGYQEPGYHNAVNFYSSQNNLVPLLASLGRLNL